VIDKKGISFAIKSCIEKAFKELKLKPQETKVFLDGGLKAPRDFVFQETIIKGDDKILAISLASITAKVSRDNFMEKLSKKYPSYGFEVHKGYGTEKHRKAIKKYGLSGYHRISFCQKY
jgi:ribonuclease HII